MERLAAPPMPGWLERQLPFRRYRVDVGGVAMHVMESGEGPAVFMLHGNPTWGYLYRKVAAALANDRIRIIAPDLVGLGFSDKPADAREHTLAGHAAWIGALIDRLALERLVFVGQDWGGPIGLRALADRRCAVGLVLMNTVAGPPRPGFRPTAFHRFARVPFLSDVAFRLLGFPQNTVAFAQGDRRRLPREVARAYRYPLRRVRDRVAPLALARMVPDSFEHPSIGALRTCEAYVAAFDGPSAIVWGSRDPVLGRTLGRLERALPRARVTRTDAGHFLQEQVPDAIADAVRFVVQEAFGR